MFEKLKAAEGPVRMKNMGQLTRCRKPKSIFLALAIKLRLNIQSFFFSETLKLGF
jgi:hypothetical protein